MKRTMFAGLACLLAASWISAGAFAQGLYYETTSGVQAEGDVGRTYLMPKMFKHVSAGTMILFRLDRDKMYSVDLQNKTYWEMTLSEMEAMMTQASAMIEEAFKDLPPEQRKMVERQMAGMMGGGGSQVVVSATGEKRTIGGYACSKWVASQDGKPLVVAWVTRDLRAFEPLAEDWRTAYKRMNAGNQRLAGGLVNAFQQLEGFPMEMEVLGVRALVTKVEPRAIPVSEFEVPAGLKQVASPVQSMRP